MYGKLRINQPDGSYERYYGKYITIWQMEKEQLKIEHINMSNFKITKKKRYYLDDFHKYSMERK